MKAFFFIAALVGVLLIGPPTRANTELVINADPIPLETGCTLEKEVTDELASSHRHYTLLQHQKLEHFKLEAARSPYADYFPRMIGLSKIYIIDALLDTANPPPYKIDHVFGIDMLHQCIVLYFNFPDEILQLAMSEEPNWIGHPKQYPIGMKQFKLNPDNPNQGEDYINGNPRPLSPQGK